MLLCHHSPAEMGLARFCCVLDDIMLHTRTGIKYIIKGIFFHRYIYLSNLLLLLEMPLQD